MVTRALSGEGTPRRAGDDGLIKTSLKGCSTCLRLGSIKIATVQPPVPAHRGEQIRHQAISAT